MSTLRRVGLVFVSCIILLLAVICPVSAYEYDSLISREEFIEFGYIEGENNILYVPSGGYDGLSFISLFLATEMNYPDFNPNQIPWKSTPQYIQDIINNGFNNVYSLSDYSSDNTSVVNDYKMPFILVKVDGNNNRVLVWVGYNLFLGVNTSSMALRICSSNYYPNISCYRAIYSLSDFSITSPWSVVSSSDWGDTGLVNSYTTNLASVSDSFDFYFYGGNTARPNAASVSFPVSTGSDAQVVAVCNESIGFQDGKYFQFSSSWINLYCSYFKPSYYSSVDGSIVDDYNDAENDLVNGYNPDDLSGDLDVEIDSSAWGVIFNIFSTVVTGNSVIVTLIITMLSLGFIALILNR